MITSPFADPRLWLLAGWSMLHLFWIGMLIGVIALVTRQLIRTCNPQARYAVALGWFALLAISPLPVGWWVWQSNPVEEAIPAAGQAAGYRNTNDSRALDSNTEFVNSDETPTAASSVANSSPLEPVIANGIHTAETTIADQAPHSTNTPSAAEEPIAQSTSAIPDFSPHPPVAVSPRHEQALAKPWTPTILAKVHAVIAALPWLWFVGTPATFLLLATGLLGAERLRRQSQPIVDADMTAALARFSTQFGLRMTVAVGVCDRIAGPILVGIVRPMILLPSAALCQWTPEQLEMVLWHELSHIRRWDNLVNLLQRIVESLLFFVPAVWILSRWVRLEREHCCDRCVVAQTGKPREYAQTLVQIADRRLATMDRRRKALSGLHGSDGRAPAADSSPTDTQTRG